MYKPVWHMVVQTAMHRCGSINIYLVPLWYTSDDLTVVNAECSWHASFGEQQAHYLLSVDNKV